MSVQSCVGEGRKGVASGWRTFEEVVGTVVSTFGEGTAGFGGALVFFLPRGIDVEVVLGWGYFPKGLESGVFQIGLVVARPWSDMKRFNAHSFDVPAKYAACAAKSDSCLRS